MFIPGCGKPYKTDKFLSKMDKQIILKRKLSLLEDEHRDLDTLIESMMKESVVNQLAIQRLKKRKLLLRDQICKIHSELLPDIIA
jgi:hypothetical protein